MRRERLELFRLGRSPDVKAFAEPLANSPLLTDAMHQLAEARLRLHPHAQRDRAADVRSAATAARLRGRRLGRLVLLLADDDRPPDVAAAAAAGSWHGRFHGRRVLVSLLLAEPGQLRENAGLGGHQVDAI